MRKLIPTSLAVVFALVACERSTNVLDRIPSGSQVTVTTGDGRAVSGRLAESRGNLVVIQTEGGAAKVPRADITAVTVSTVQARATGAATSGTDAPKPGAPAAVPAPPPDAGPAGRDDQPEERLAETRGAEAGAVDRPGTPVTARRPAFREVTVPAGTVLPIRLEESLASDRSRVEEGVTATLLRSVAVGGVTAVPAGSVVSGTVTHARRSGRVKGVAELAIRFDHVKPKGADETYRVRTGLVARRAPTTHKKDALEIGVPAAGGAIVGGLLGGKKGALVGGTVGGGAGTAVVLSTRGKEVRLPRGTRLSIRLLEPVTVRVPA